MKRFCLLLLALLFTGCASSGLFQAVQISHDSLATAQDIEAQLCWGVPNAAAGPADRTHCTTVVATTIKLTDARHQALNAKFVTAFNLHKAVTQQAKAGKNVDVGALASIVQSILAIVGELQQTPAVAQLAESVQAGRIK